MANQNTAPFLILRKEKQMWTDEKIEQLKILHAQGLTYDMIAKKLGAVSKSAVSGKINRLKLTRPKRQALNNFPAARKPRCNAKKFERHEGAKKDFGELYGQFKAKQCCWPIGDPKSPDFKFCTAEQEIGSYCVHHYEIAYNRTYKKSS